MIPRLLQHRPIERSDMQARTALPDGPILQRRDLTAISPTSSQSSINIARSASSSPPPPPPPTPQAWIWRCHICNATFRLSCTRRCLHCGHVMCTTPPAPQPSSNSSSRRRSRAGPCAMEFDYERWAAWGDWRRLRHIVEEEDTLRQETKPPWGEREAQRKRRLYDRVGSCRDDCDYPSECHHLRSGLWQRFTVVDGGEVSPLSPLALSPDSPSMEEAARSILRMGVEEADCVFAAADYLESRFAGAHQGEKLRVGV
ncbi:hypothetical protein CGCF415_v001997 [Colletotrichum fructicola]|nr:hypothetical protein CGCFRS4_v001577 [Colletotrichum fructicola]KAF4914700.1 hypothetical protein CGCF415_v001997 [Colletotrichum fructicola]KAF4941204.1 hypothetical protein CGCF245_v001780 [Colletotrichum fructicola]